MLNHWLWYKYRCHEGSPNDFQKLFEEIIKRARPEFFQIRPYGNIGDRKCDGLFACDGTIFQVYSPDTLRLEDTKAKIEEDFDGAVKHWQTTIKKWVFVYNCRRGLAPDIPQLLAEKIKQYKNIQIDHISNDHLWEMARKLTLQQRCEILGAPVGYEHLFLSSQPTPPESAAVLKRSYVVLIHDVMTPIDLSSVVDGLDPELPFGAPVFVRPDMTTGDWEKAAAYQASVVSEAVARTRDVLSRFAVFSLSQIPLTIHLGFVLSDRIAVRYHQFDRVQKTWRWPITEPERETRFDIAGLPKEEDIRATDVVLRIALSAPIRHKDTQRVVQGEIEVDLTVPEPSVLWLQHPAQLTEFVRTLHVVFETLRRNAPNGKRIHLFYAGPTAGAVVVGQHINPRMTPPVHLYEYSHQATPRYRHVLTLKDEKA